MYLVSVLPVTKTSGRNPISYFSLEKLSPGSLVKISLRKKEVKAVVISTESLKNRKSEIRQANFQLKKIRKSDVLKKTVELKALEKIAEYYATSVGALLSAFKL